jgi:hypothetical protein
MQQQLFADLADALRRDGYNATEIDQTIALVREFRELLRAERKHHAEAARAYIAVLENLNLELRAVLQNLRLELGAALQPERTL